MASNNLSPRQRMINMMYLVLTALLALNVSKEVLNSFFEVNKGIERTTNNFKSKNSETYAAFDNAASNNPVKYKEVRDLVFSLKSESEDIIMYLQEMKYNLVNEADGNVCLGYPGDVLDENGKPKEESIIEGKIFSDLTPQQKMLPIAYLNAKSDRYASSQLFLDKKVVKSNQVAYLLSEKIRLFKDKLISAVPENANLVSTINQVCDVEPRKKSDGNEEDWEVYNFNDMPAVGALTILSKIQSDLRNIEADVIDYLKRNIDAKTLKFSSAEGVQIPNSNFVLKGDSFRAQIFISGKDDAQNPEIYVGEYDSLGGGVYEMRGEYETVKVVNGKGMFSKRTISEGKKKWGGLIVKKTESGNKYFPFVGEYLVAAKQAVAAPTNMNVLYTQVDNPIKVSVPGYSAAQIIATTSNGTIRAVDKRKGEWIVRPDKLQREEAPVINLYVNDEGKRKSMGSVDFKVKDVPDPVAKAAGLKKNTVSKGDLKASQMLIAELKDFPFDRKDLSFVIVSYDIVAYTSKGRSNYPTVEKTGGRFNNDVLRAIDATAPGATITFSNIRAKRRGTKGLKIRDLGSITYTIK